MTTITHYNGFSSLLFIISSIKSIYVSKLFLWKLSNSLLVLASYLFNTTHNETCLCIDYIAICFVCTSYLNNSFINSILFLSLISEYKKTNNIVSTKNVTFALTVSKSIYNTYLYVDKTHFYIVLSSVGLSTIVHSIRYNLVGGYSNKNHLLLTWCLHFFIMNVMYVSSITAV